MIEDIYPLSPMQQGMLFHNVFAPQSSMYFEQMSCAVRGELDLAALERAWQGVMDRHPVLRSSFAWEELDEPVQIVESEVKVPLTVMDWTMLDQPEQSSRLNEFLAADRAAGFNLQEAPLMRVALIRMGAQQSQLVWSHHHVLVDGWSLPLLLREVFALYEAHRKGEPLELTPPRPFRDYIAWLQQQDMDQAESFWRNYLHGFAETTPLPLAQTLPQNFQDDHGERRVRLSPELVAKLTKLTRSYKLTLNTVFQGAWALLLSRYSGQGEVVFGATVSGRPGELEGVERMLGLFINTLPVRVEVDDAQCVGEWLRHLQARAAEARQYEFTPLASLQRWSELGSGRSLFDSLLVFENFPVGSDLGRSASSIAITQVSSFTFNNFPLTLLVGLGGDLRLLISYDRSLFSEDAVKQLMDHVLVLLASIADNAENKLCNVSPLTASERNELIVECNQTEREYERNACVHQLFERQVEQTPDAIALVSEGRTLSYRELNADANRLASRLRELGVGPEIRVAIMIERSVELVVSLLAVLKAGGAYVPLDPDYPEARRRYMLDDCRPAVLLTAGESLPRWTGPTLHVDREKSGNEENLDLDLDPSSLAYVIYTSGSTGEPKGAMNAHRGVVNRLLWMQEEYRLGDGDAVLQKTPFSFDVSVWEFFLPLMTGARLVLAASGGHRDAAYLVRLIQSAQVTTVHFVPSLLRAFLEEPEAAGCSRTLRRVICSGEALSWNLKERFFEVLKGVELHNLYGPTEAAVDVTAWSCQNERADRVVPIGYPVANTQVYVLDQRMELVPRGVAGELYIGGVQVGRGYLHRPSLTAEKFVPNPFGTGDRLYRTGDMVRRLADGEIEYLDRADQQVKVRGFRIELGEIEATLVRHHEVRECVVVADTTGPAEKRLVAYVVAEGQVTAAELTLLVQQSLPEYMVPATFVFLSQLPLTPSGKLDRKALPAPGSIDVEIENTTFEPPSTPIEEDLAKMWTEVLRVDRVGINDNFFAIGGDSILSIQIISRVRSAFGVEIPLPELFRTPTIKRLAEIVEERFLAASDTSRLEALLGELEDMEDEEAQSSAPGSFVS